MIWIVLSLGYLAIAICVAILVVPKLFRHLVGFFSIGSRLYLAGLVRIILGILLLILASQTRFWAYVVILGLICASAGLSIFFFPLRRTKKLLYRLQKQSDLALRLFAIIGLALWGLLVYSLLAAIPVSFPH